MQFVLSAAALNFGGGYGFGTFWRRGGRAARGCRPNEVGLFFCQRLERPGYCANFLFPVSSGLPDVLVRSFQQLQVVYHQQADAVFPVKVASLPEYVPWFPENLGDEQGALLYLLGCVLKLLNLFRPHLSPAHVV